MKYLPTAVIVFVFSVLLGCDRSHTLTDVSGEWEIASEISTEFNDGKIIRCDTSNFCWLFVGRPFVRLFADSTYIVFDTITRKQTKFLEPYTLGKFTVDSDTLWFDAEAQRIIKLANDTLILKRINSFNDRELVKITLLVKSPSNVDLSHFNFPKNRIDTVTNISAMSMRLHGGRELNYSRFDRAYLYHNDTIYRVVRDIPQSGNLNLDSLIDDCDIKFQSYDMGDYGFQAGVCGHSYENILYSFQNYTTYYSEWYCRDMGYIEAFHGDWYHGFYTIDSNGKEVVLSDLIKPSANIVVNFLIADAIIAYRTKTGWLEGYDEDVLRSIRMRYAKLNYENCVALGGEGLIVSLNYGDDADICFAENYVHAIVPYTLIKPYLQSAFKDI